MEVAFPSGLTQINVVALAAPLGGGRCEGSQAAVGRRKRKLSYRMFRGNLMRSSGHSAMRYEQEVYREKKIRSSRKVGKENVSVRAADLVVGQLTSQRS